MVPCSLCTDGIVTIAHDWQDPITRRYFPAGTRVRCDNCHGSGNVPEPYELVRKALRNLSDDQWRQVEDALVTVLDDLRGAGLRSPAMWVIASMLSGKLPPTEELRKQAGERASERIAAKRVS